MIAGAADIHQVDPLGLSDLVARELAVGVTVNLDVDCSAAFREQARSHKGRFVGSVRVTRHFGTAAAHQEIEIATLVRLQHMVDV